MNYKEKQKSFRQRLKKQVKTIWISKEIATVPHPTLEKQFIKVVRLVNGTYVKPKKESDLNLAVNNKLKQKYERSKKEQGFNGS